MLLINLQSYGPKRVYDFCLSRVPTCRVWNEVPLDFFPLGYNISFKRNVNRTLMVENAFTIPQVLMMPTGGGNFSP